ncbi:nicotinate phosphoribosyltransferase [Acetitomaculum ruminis DSM 5522]|uniref:Nicotinate phosphoribosyltransferase n=1 Tax=Acetitomaculum ruminis DSM 5522 TaxID=1120918 RepID=A0A1I0X2K6_9FIRM|nr:nicotinate phosphoribosyltransferase [Acetitomaculum ruminis]SFA94323.1 nicotinate phosphoribosyltransferase [Acetitomaculum ruminis DSM 5522]
METRDLTLLTDLYELTMMQGYFKRYKDEDEIAVFDVFYRENPYNGGYAIACGLEQVIDYIKNLKFTKEDIDYLDSLNTFDKEFLDYLANFKFSGDLYAIPEGTVVFPREPLIKVIAPISEAQLIEPAILNFINHQSLIATKTSRVVYAADGEGVMEFGLRRAQGADAGTFGARAAVIAGCIGTSNVLAGKFFGIPVMGTHAHSWIMSFPDEYTAFKNYAKLYPNNCLLLVDTYDTLNSGVPNAIRVFKEMKEEGIELKKYGIRLDSGDLAYLSKEARKMLDEAGFENAIISASNDLDENLITSLHIQGAKINSWGVGTHMITSKGWSSFGGVYKLAAVQDEEGIFVPKIKLSENTEKITNPGNKKIYRIYNKDDGYIRADLLSMNDESYIEDKDLELFDSVDTWKSAILKAGTFKLRELFVQVFDKGNCVYESPSVMEIRENCQKELATLRPETRRLINPTLVPVDLSNKLFRTKMGLFKEMSGKVL